MHLTAQDKRAAREGFAYVVIRGGKRVCYASTLGEAKRECGKQGKVVAISGMTYAAKNPKRPAPPPKSAKEKAIRTTLYYLNTGSHEWPIGRFSSKKDAREYAKQYFGADVLDSQWKGMRILSAKEREDEFWGERNPLSGGEMSRSKAEAAYARADRAYTKAVETYGGFDAKTVAAYRRRQKAEQVLHAILRRNPSAAQVGHSVGKHAKYAARGAKKVGKKAWAGTKSFFGGLTSGYKKHNPKHRDSRGVEHDFSNDVYPKSLFPWGVSYKKKLPAAYGEPSIVVDGQLSFMTEADAHQWATSPRVAKSGYFGTRVFQRNPRKRR